MSNERRDADRIPFPQDVVVFAHGRALTCESTDLSASGIGLLPPAKARPGLHVIVDMSLEGGQSVAIEGYVVREGDDADRYVWGVRFHDVPPRVQRMLTAFVEQERAKHPPALPPPAQPQALSSSSRPQPPPSRSPAVPHYDGRPVPRPPQHTPSSQARPAVPPPRHQPSRSSRPPTLAPLPPDPPPAQPPEPVQPAQSAPRLDRPDADFIDMPRAVETGERVLLEKESLERELEKELAKLYEEALGKVDPFDKKKR